MHKYRPNLALTINNWQLTIIRPYPYGKPYQPIFEFGEVNLRGKKVAKDTIFLER